MKLGAHVSISGELKNAAFRGRGIGCEVLQIFTSNPKGWSFKVRTESEINEFRKALSDSQIERAYGHSIYLTNLASANPYIYTNSINSLVSGLVFAKRASLEGVVTHIGSHGGTGVKEGLERVINALKQSLKITEEEGSIIFLETDAGSGNHLGAKFEEIGVIIKGVNSERVRICLDTCHVFAAGYDISSEKGLEKMLQEFEEHIGLEKLGILHLNDSKGELGSKVDRHEEIGKGKIGIESFGRIINHPKLCKLDAIVETPDNKENIETEKPSIDILKELRKC